jgi:hypothetical protein
MSFTWWIAMPLIEIWKTNPAAVAQFTIEQVVAAAGRGDLRDGAECATELRMFLREAPTSRLADYTEHCLTQSFMKSGSVLQDLVNELGRRLDYAVENGRYQGVVNAIGFDGIWHAPEGNYLVIETKTTDAYRVSLDKLAEYRRALIDQPRISSESSILIVTGRADTGELEAQIRGSRHAWDIRLISVDALLNLVRIKEATDSKETVQKIRRLLVPMEYTRLDELIDVIFATARDVGTPEAPEAIEAQAELAGGDSLSRSGWQFTDSRILDTKRETILRGVSGKVGKNLIKYSRALYWDAEHRVRAAVTMSKRYERKGQYPYWYAYHPKWDTFLGEGSGFFVLGCMDKDVAYALPVEWVRPWLADLQVSQTKDGSHYWHIKLVEMPGGHLGLSIPRKEPVSLQEFEMTL